MIHSFTGNFSSESTYLPPVFIIKYQVLYFQWFSKYSFTINYAAAMKLSLKQSSVTREKHIFKYFPTQKHSWLQPEIIINKFSTDIDLNMNTWKAMHDNIFIIFLSYVLYKHI